MSPYVMFPDIDNMLILVLSVFHVPDVAALHGSD